MAQPKSRVPKAWQTMAVAIAAVTINGIFVVPILNRDAALSTRVINGELILLAIIILIAVLWAKRGSR